VSDLIGKVIDFNFPTMEELGRIGRNERLNLFRRYFSASRYDRLLIQQQLVRSTYDVSLISKVKELENLHDQDFIDKVRMVKEYNFYNEFLDAANEEEQGLQKIIEAYDKRRQTC
jgi:hypothetical protein